MANVTMTTAQMRGYISDRLPGSVAEGILRAFDAVLADLAAANARIDLLSAWGTALATKMNADTGIADANYDTTPES